MRSPLFLKSKNFRFGLLSQLLNGKFLSGNKSLSAKDLKEKITSPEFEERIKLLLKKDLEKHYSRPTIEEVLGDVSFLILDNEKLSVLDDETETTFPVPDINYVVEDDKMDEIFKVQSRVPGWFKKPNQINSRILVAYMELLGDNNSVPYYKLESSCRTIKTFKNNYSQMKSFGEKNHAKVFEEAGSRITLWEPVREFVKKEYNQYLRRKEC